MTSESMKTFRCWSAESVGQTVFSDIGALASDADALFLAAHTPVDLDHRKGPEVAGQSGEAQVLQALLSRVGDRERNTLIAVTGASGSGKSHVVRWVHAHLDLEDPRYRVLYVPRAIQTIRELLRRIIEGLPEVGGSERSELMKRVDAAISGLKPGELQERLVAEMKIALNWTLEDRAAHEGETEDEAAAREDRNSLLGERNDDGGRRDGMADLLEVPAIKKALQRPEGRLSQLVQSYFDETSRRDEDIFTRDDLPLRERGVLGSLAGRAELKELWQIIQRQPDDALALLDEALRVALPKALGLRSAGGETLDSLFSASRRALLQQRQGQGQELILLFEDLAQFGLVEGELYNQFVTQPGADLAPLRVVFAVTDGPFAKMERTVRTRVEHEFRVGDSALAQPESFVGRYLNLVRVGRDTSQQLWRQASTPGAGRDSWMANACDTLEEGRPCRFRDTTCHETFGAVEIAGLGKVGLYPYNEQALSRALTGTSRRAIEKTGQPATPREVIDECVVVNLQEADSHIADETYPHERTRSLFDFSTRMGKDALLAQHPSSDPERTYRALVIWGNEASLKPGVMEAFALDGERRKDEPGPTPPPPPPPAPPTDDLPNPLLSLFQWQNDAELPEDDVNTYRTTLHQLTLPRLNLDQSLAHTYSGRGKQMLDELFNQTSFSLEGARGRRAGADSIRFELTRSPEDVRLLAAARWFRDHGHFNPARAAWQWPEGYDPVQLMLELEARLDQWAAAVRGRFLEVTGGIDLAKRALGLRAIALVATGREPAGLTTTSNVLAAPDGQHRPPSGSWAEVETVASGIAATLRADEYVGEFAAVRQGEDGRPQLVDSRDLDESLCEALLDPRAALERAAERGGDPVLSQVAQQLLDAISRAVAAEAAATAQASATVATQLQGLSPADVAETAKEIGRDARDAGLFRPVEGWNQFQHAVDVLAAAGATVQPPEGDHFNAVLLSQHAARRTAEIASALDTVANAMSATQQECERSGSVAGDVSSLRAEVKAQVDELATLVNSLAVRGRP